jgi:hypothetical protein
MVDGRLPVGGRQRGRDDLPWRAPAARRTIASALEAEVAEHIERSPMTAARMTRRLVVPTDTRASGA